MELSFDMFPILSTFIFLVLMILKLYKQSKPKLPPGPWKLPIIGSVHHLAGSLPHRRLKDLADKHGPLMHLQLGELSLFVVSSSEVAKEVMKTNDANFADRPFNLAGSIAGYDTSGIMFSPYGECWRQLRKICNMELLSSKQVQSLRAVREDEVSKFIKSISQNPGTAINLSKSLSSLIYGITAKSAFGKKCKEQDAFISLVNDGVTVGGGFSLSDLFPSSKLLAFLSSTRAELEKVHQGYDRIMFRSVAIKIFPYLLLSIFDYLSTLYQSEMVALGRFAKRVVGVTAAIGVTIVVSVKGNHVFIDEFDGF